MIVHREGAMPDETNEQSSVLDAGPFYRVEQRFGLTRPGLPGLTVRTLVAIGVSFVPLVALAAYQGVLFGQGVTLPLVKDLTVYARFAIAVPLLLHAERLIEGRLSQAITHFRTCHVVEGEARAGFEDALGRLMRSVDALLPEIILFVASFVLALFSSRPTLGHAVSSWQVIAPGPGSRATWAGMWLEFVSLPFFGFLVTRWLWRIFLWSRFLLRVSRLNLTLVPTHPDGAGGLAFLGIIHTAFGAILVPMAMTVAARGVQWVQIGGGAAVPLRNALIAFIVVALIVPLGPLLVFVPRLLATRRNGLLEYAKLATDYTRAFDRKWVRQPPGPEEPMLGTGDIQSLADLANSYEVIKRMGVVPFSRQNALALAVATVLPMLPFIALIFPLAEMLKLMGQLVLK